ncbi:MAG TPA: hypothetical protein VLF71_02060 [Candidatus Saccharimonadales bacterium]|nr:hypothetical protein [Candidatus Saccharimonadales bacterium]
MTIPRIPPNEIAHLVNPRWTDIIPERRNQPHDQRTWEKAHYLAVARMALEKGNQSVAVFYLAAQDPDAPAPNESGRAYAQGTRSEFSDLVGLSRMAQWLGKRAVPIVIGFENPSMPGLSEYRHVANEFGWQIHQGLPATIHGALEVAFPGNRPPLL